MKKSIGNTALLLILFFGGYAYGQLPDCTLGVGGKDTEILKQVFQMNQEQINSLDQWAGELQTANKLKQDEIEQLLATHPQSTEEDLILLAEKYKALQAQMVATARAFDQKLLGIFNPKQYERYVALCNEALREPIIPLAPEKPVVVKENPE